MEAKCKYCGSKNLVLKDGEWVCVECAAVISPVYVWPRLRITKKEAYLAILRGYA